MTAMITGSIIPVTFMILPLLYISFACQRFATFQSIPGCIVDFDSTASVILPVLGIDVLSCADNCYNKKGCKAISWHQGIITSTCNLLSSKSNGTCSDLVVSDGWRYLELDEGCRGGSACMCYPVWKTGPDCDLYYKDCTEASDNGLTGFSRMEIQPASAQAPFEVKCALDYGGWTLLEERASYCTTTFHDRGLHEYEDGFGDLSCAFFIGLKKMYHILQNGVFKLNLKVVGDDINAHVYYEDFRIGDKAAKYVFDWTTFRAHSIHPADDGFDYGGPNHNMKGALFGARTADLSGCAVSENTGWWYSTHCPYINLHLPMDDYSNGTLGSVSWPLNGELKPLSSFILQVQRTG